jgi:integrase
LIFFRKILLHLLLHRAMQEQGGNMAKVAFTAPKVAGFKCPADKKQAFLWDSTAPGLGLRATPAGKPAYIFQGVYQGSTLRITIGSPAVWPLEDSKRKTPAGEDVVIQGARSKARELQRMIDEGIDPRAVKRESIERAHVATQQAAQDAQAAKVAALTMGEVWTDYLERRRPFWGALHYRDHVDKASAGGLPSKRRGQTDKLTQPGPLAALMPLALKDLDQVTVEAWAAKEGQTRPSSARLAWRLLTVFLTWCGEQPEYAALVPLKNPAKAKKAREALGKVGTKRDTLQKTQLNAWFGAVRQIQNPTISACLQVLLLTGARLNEVLAMRWEDVNTQWKGINIHDKVEGSREIPLTPYVESLITALPRRNEYVFASTRTLAMNERNILRRARKSAAKGKTPPPGAILETSATGYISEPNTPHARACRTVGIDGLTLHGLRRSFASLTEWLEVPAGVVAQIQGHKPSATREKHYIVRPLDLLRIHHERIEAWILEQAGVTFLPDGQSVGLHAVGT